jgi:hypothetical protein
MFNFCPHDAKLDDNQQKKNRREYLQFMLEIFTLI